MLGGEQSLLGLRGGRIEGQVGESNGLGQMLFCSGGGRSAQGFESERRAGGKQEKKSGLVKLVRRPGLSYSESHWQLPDFAGRASAFSHAGMSSRPGPGEKKNCVVMQGWGTSWARECWCRLGLGGPRHPGQCLAAICNS